MNRQINVETATNLASMAPAFVSSFTPCAAAGVARSATTFLNPLQDGPSRCQVYAPARTSMFFLFKPFQRKDVVDLPQRDRDHRQQRKAEVKEAREKYVWTNTGVGDASLIDGVPDGEFPQLGWIESVAVIVARVAINAALSAADDLSESAESSILSKIAQLVSPVLYKLAVGQFKTDDALEAYTTLKDIIGANASGQGVTLDDYRDMFRNIKLDTVAKLDQFLRDDIFGWYRVAGPNCMRITKLPGQASDMFPDLTDDIFNGIASFGGDSLKAAAADGRLFYVDYKEFDGVPTGKDVDGNVKDSYIYAPKALLAVPINDSDRTTVLPIAIQCGQDSSYPMYTANPDHTDSVTWLAAKLTVQVADSVIHESVYHLARTHLMIELFICSTYRSMPESHPLHRLLKNHFYGTAFINNAAVISLINPGGIIDQITAPQIETTRDLSAKGVNDPNFSFNDWMPDKEMASRGVLHADKLKFPYRDDVMELWPAINEWVRAFLSAYYKSDADVQGDYELADWCEEIVGPGNLHGFGETPDGKIRTLDYLVRAVSMIIFTASVQHASVNFPQATLMQYAPSMPLGGYAPAPKTAKPFDSVNDWITKMVPDLARAEQQLITSELIGVLKYTTLGEYGKDLQFAPDEVDDALEDFQEKLGLIGAKIQARNIEERRAGLPVYNYLVPKNIPQSINI